MKKYCHKKKFDEHQYEMLIEQYNYHISITHIDFARNYENIDHNVLLIRHDIDHDIETALKMAKWENKNRLQATYCILHSAWYYGSLENDSIIHHPNLIEWIKEIQDLGHEINFHNNLVATALSNGLEPSSILKQELAYLREHDINIHGTSTHGDPLCRQLNFRNWEIFKECCDEKFGGPRTVTHLGADNINHSVELGKHSMNSFELLYEAYDLPKHIYHTDSGGNLKVLYNVHGRREFADHDFSDIQIVGVLAHPVWWNFT